MNAIKNFWRGQIDLCQYHCIVCGKLLLNHRDIFASRMYGNNPGTYKFIRIDEETDTYVALCTNSCEELYRITPDEYVTRY